MYSIKPAKLPSAVFVINTQNPKCVDRRKNLRGCWNHILLLILGLPQAQSHRPANGINAQSIMLYLTYYMVGLVGSAVSKLSLKCFLTQQYCSFPHLQHRFCFLLQFRRRLTDIWWLIYEKRGYGGKRTAFSESALKTLLTYELQPVQLCAHLFLLMRSVNVFNTALTPLQITEVLHMFILMQVVHNYWGTVIPLHLLSVCSILS